MQDHPTIVCPHCGAVNRVPRARLEAGDKPSCGQCHRPLFDGRPVEIASAAVFERIVGRTEIPVLVDFWAEWCGPCRAMAPHFAAATQALEPRARLVKLDTEAAPEAARRLHIQGIPTTILFSGGREIARHVGLMTKDAITAFVERNRPAGA
jgi:thioredoxin 2